jgi:hypothetical protein
MKFQIAIDTAIEVLQKNLDEHVTELTEARTEWTKLSIVALEKYRDAIDRTGLDASIDELYKLSYSRPKDSRKEYSKFMGAMKRAKQDGQTHVTVDEDDYDRIFNDNWEWRVASKTSNSTYTVKK